jgi:hypothetical protein
VSGPLPADPRPIGRWNRASRVAFDFALLFGVAMLAKQLLPASATYPDPLWLPVVALSLLHGIAAGAAAAGTAVALSYAGGLPPQLMSEDLYGYIGRIAAEPMGWTCVALLIGHIRSRQIARQADLEAELAERSNRGAAVADLCVDLRARTESLERQIAANAHASNIEIAEAVSDLHCASWDDFEVRLTRFVVLMTGAAEFAIYLLREDALRLAFQPSDDHHVAGHVPSTDPLFPAIVNERRTIAAERPDERALLGAWGSRAGPLLDASGRAIGMLAIGGVSLDDHPEDIGRRFAFTASEISRLIGRIELINSWRNAAQPIATNGHGGASRPLQLAAGAAAPRSEASLQ